MALRSGFYLSRENLIAMGGQVTTISKNSCHHYDENSTKKYCSECGSKIQQFVRITHSKDINGIRIYQTGEKKEHMEFFISMEAESIQEIHKLSEFCQSIEFFRDKDVFETYYDD